MTTIQVRVGDELKKKLIKWLKNEPISFRCYKIKLRASGFRLVYQIIDSEVVILVIAIGKREESKANSLAEMRIQK